MLAHLRALFALVVVMAGATAAQATNRYDLSASAWTDICTAPCELQWLAGANVLYVIDTVAPGSLDAGAQVLGQSLGRATATASGAHVYARSAIGLATLATTPIASPGGSGTVNAKAAPGTGTGGITAATVGTSSTQVLAAGTRIAVLTIQNVSTSASVACALGTSATLNTAGSFQLAAGQLLTLSNGAYIPGDAINCIASASIRNAQSTTAGKSPGTSSTAGSKAAPTVTHTV